MVERETEVITMHRHSQEGETEEAFHLRKRRKDAQSPSRSEKVRSVSQTTAVYLIDNDASQDAENIGSGRPKTVDRVASTPSVMTKVRSSRRQAESPLRTKEAGIRKTSGRVGSNSTATSATAASTARKVSSA